MLPPYEIISQSEFKTIHENSLEVLDAVGLRIDHPLALEKLAGAGAHVDQDRGTVRIPPDLVEHCLESAPKSYTLAGRTPEFDRILGSDATRTPLFRTEGGAVRYHDLLTGENRALRIQDCRDMTRLSDGLEHIDWVSALTLQDFHPQPTYDIHLLREMLCSGRKHIWALTLDSRNLRYQLEMMEAVAGGRDRLRQRPLCSGIVCLIEPFTFPYDEIERLLLYGRCNLPVEIPLAPICGLTAPYTLAGTIVHTNAAALGSQVVLQTLCPGIPSSYYFFIQTLEMHKGRTDFLSPESLLVSSSLARLGAHYRLPVVTAAIENNGCESIQMMFERGTSLLMSTLGGVGAIGGAGGFEKAIFTGPLALVLDDELMAYVKRIWDGFRINQETIGLETMKRMGHSGNYLSDEHTVKYLYKEKRFTPSLFDWRPFVEWSQEGTTLLERARDHLNNLLKHHEVPPLEEILIKELDKIVQAADRELAGA